MIEEKTAVKQIALQLPAKLSINADEPDAEALVYDAKTRLINMKGLLLVIDPNHQHVLTEGDYVTCTLIYKRKLFYSDSIIIKIKNNELVLRFLDTEFERLMVLKYILEDSK